MEPVPPALEVESFRLDHQGSPRPVPFRMRACLERAEEREGTARRTEFTSCEPSLGLATWQCALTERQFHSPPVPSRNPETSSVLSPRNALPRVGTATVFTGKLGTNWAAHWSRKREQWELITNPSEAHAGKVLKLELEGRGASSKSVTWHANEMMGAPSVPMGYGGLPFLGGPLALRNHPAAAHWDPSSILSTPGCLHASQGGSSPLTPAWSMMQRGPLRSCCLELQNWHSFPKKEWKSGRSTSRQGHLREGAEWASVTWVYANG